MRSNKTTTALVLATCLVPVVAFAGSAPKNLPEKVQAMHCMVGKWKAKGTLQMGDQKVPIAGKMKCKSISAGFGIGCSTVITGIPGLDKYEEQDIWGYDAGTDKYHMFSVTNGGETHDHSGKMTNDGWVGTYEGVHDGKPMVEKISFRFTGDDTLAISSAVTIGGQQASRLEAVLER